MNATSTECYPGHPDCDYSDAIAASKVANQKGRTMYHAFQRLCSEVGKHATFDPMEHEHNVLTKNKLQDAFNRLKRKAEEKGIIWLPTQPNAV